jgi:hypothetical protein
MTEQEAYAEADSLLEALLRSGDEEIFAAANGDLDRLVSAALRARSKLAAEILRENASASTIVRLMMEGLSQKHG